jgi:hypothetical protein
MLCHAIPSVWRGQGLTVGEVTLPSHLIEAHIDSRARLAQLQARPPRVVADLSFPLETEHARGRSAFWLALAAAHGALWDVERLLRAGATPNEFFTHERPGAGALGHAAGNGHLAVVNRLLRAGADAGAYANVALIWAAGRGHADVVRRLLREPGVDAGARDGMALRWAQQRSHEAVVQLLAPHHCPVGSASLSTA